MGRRHEPGPGGLRRLPAPGRGARHLSAPVSAPRRPVALPLPLGDRLPGQELDLVLVGLRCPVCDRPYAGHGTGCPSSDPLTRREDP